MTLIDHIFVRLPHKRSDRKLLSRSLFSDITDHWANCVCIEVSAKNNVNKRAKTRIYYDNNYKSVFKTLAEVDWETGLEILQTVDTKYIISWVLLIVALLLASLKFKCLGNEPTIKNG